MAARHPAINLGNGHILNPSYHGDDDELVGFLEDHPNAKDSTKTCGGAGLFDTEYVKREFLPRGKERPLWKLTGEWPEITLNPSILCTSCGNHGWVRDGRWVDA